MTKPHTTLSEAVRALELPAEAGAWSSPLRYGSKIGFPKPVKPQDWDDDEQDWFCNPYYSADQVHALLESVAKLVEQHEAQEPFGPIVAYASSSEFRRNQLLSKAQYDNCLPKNRVDFDIPLVAVSKCDMCNDNGSVGFPPDDYYPCPKCTPPTLAATQAGDAWISVQDRLPEMHTEVMVWPHPSDYIMTAEVDRNGAWSYNEYCSNWGNENVKLTQGRITHWMPLPSAPTTTRSE